MVENYSSTDYSMDLARIILQKYIFFTFSSYCTTGHYQNNIFCICFIFLVCYHASSYHMWQLIVLGALAHLTFLQTHLPQFIIRLFDATCSVTFTITYFWLSSTYKDCLPIFRLQINKLSFCTFWIMFDCSEPSSRYWFRISYPAE